jgi:hypothetical protein
MTLDGRVTTAGKVSDVTSLAVSPVRNRWFAARGDSVVELLWSAPSFIQIIHIWSPPNIRKCCPEGAPVQSVNQIAIDPKSGNVFASVFTSCIYRIDIPHSVQATLLAGDCMPSACLGECGHASGDGSGAAAKFRSISALAFDSTRGELFAAEFQAVRAISVGGVVRTVAGACIKHQGYTGEFTCDYPSEDGPAREAHFSWPLRSLAVDDADGSLMILDSDLLRRIDRTGFVTTVSGNHKPQAQPQYKAWNSRYADTVSHETADVYVRGDDEIEISRTGSGQIFDVRKGLRSAAFDPAQFWIAPTYVRVGAAQPLASYEAAKESLNCGTAWAPQQKNPYQTGTSAKSERLFIGWYYEFARGQRPEFATSEHCGAFRLYDTKGSEVYEDYESRLIAHIVPDGLIEYADQRRLFR